MFKKCPYCGLPCYSDLAFRAHIAKCPKRPKQENEKQESKQKEPAKEEKKQ